LLVKNIGFSYEDVHRMTKAERNIYLEFLIEERKEEKEQLNSIRAGS